MSFIQKHPQGLTVKVFVQPRSSKNEIAGFYGDALKIKLAAPPVDGAANKMCIQYLAKYLKVPKSSLNILSGQTSRTKHVLIRYPEGKVTKNEQTRLEGLIDSLISHKKTA